MSKKRWNWQVGYATEDTNTLSECRDEESADDGGDRFDSERYSIMSTTSESNGPSYDSAESDEGEGSLDKQSDDVPLSDSGDCEAGLIPLEDDLYLKYSASNRSVVRETPVDPYADILDTDELPAHSKIQDLIPRRSAKKHKRGKERADLPAAVPQPSKTVSPMLSLLSNAQNVTISVNFFIGTTQKSSENDLKKFLFGVDE